jgi:sulfur carrier protein ThiS
MRGFDRITVLPGAERMAQLTFTPNIQRHVACPPRQVPGATVREVLDAGFADNTRARSYVLDDQGGLRRHMIVFVNGQAVRDRATLSDPVPEGAEVYVMQALSGG